ncbi:MAG: serine esterase [Verrucomicrobia bacterium]|nr:serine esterase [Verrucomicrobiota bacterium]OQC66855.1 MAG: Carboxylesterase 2 [Verrucomicrobia bacterium ADurb.Bin006]MDI9380069.1 serine esterase [Verrucomicrobiota bacterium]NMD19018.1 serine esterase [Verrucomicrobiota bacterium]HNV00445.1 serine esterase [Verrucomicrobiota bacterium]
MLSTDLMPAREERSRRLMIVLHGLGDSMEGYRWLPPALNLPWLNFLLVNAPDDYFGGYSWYDIYGDAEPGIVRSRTLLFDLLDSLGGRGFAVADTVLFGFSQGCLLTIDVGMRYPQRLAGLVGISGYAHDLDSLLQEMSPLAKQQRFLVTHGTQDPLLPIEPVRGQMQRLRRAGLKLEWREFAKAHTIAGEAEIDVIRTFIENCFASNAGA